MLMEVDLKYDGQTIPKGTRVISVKEEAFSTTFGPYSKKLLYGNYSLELLFQLSNQSKRLRRKWERTLHDSQRQVYGRLQRRAGQRSGWRGRRQLSPVGATRSFAGNFRSCPDRR